MGPPDQENNPVKTCGSFVNLDYVTEDDKHDALAACMMLCVPSEGESFGLVYMEAGRYSKPVVARALPVLQELLLQGKAGLLLGSADQVTHQVEITPTMLSDALISLIHDNETMRSLGKRCHEVSSSFVWNVVVRRFENAYLSVTG